MSFDIVIFDCDGVLIDSEIISARMLVSALARLGVAIDLDYVARHFLGRSYPTVMKVIRQRVRAGPAAGLREQYRDAPAGRLRARACGSCRACGRCFGTWSGVPFCVATSSSPRRVADVAVCWSGCGPVGRRSGHYTLASLVARGKPRRTFSCMRPRSMGLAAPDRCLVIEDSLTGMPGGPCGGDEGLAFHRRQPSGAENLPLEPPEDARARLQSLSSFAEFFQIAARD